MAKVVRPSPIPFVVPVLSSLKPSPLLVLGSVVEFTTADDGLEAFFCFSNSEVAKNEGTIPLTVDADG
jgi:hypothetical protein